YYYIYIHIDLSATYYYSYLDFYPTTNSN
ncbi:unnamed protein product, partial [Rotaria socialis]